MLANNVLVARGVHDSALFPEFLNRSVLELRSVEYLYGDDLACVVAFEALSTPHNAEVAHSDDEIEAVASCACWVVYMSHGVHSVLRCQSSIFDH